ncbi:hypothetical protein [Pseudomonas sp. xss_2]|jgi:microsomal dipeptidase-like Zn-dependent dipeptidase|uniref:hypothetical protein n=1 Tax=Pseudomonas sp. xss_2 TaxID=3367215 RepID=UPI00370A49DA
MVGITAVTINSNASLDAAAKTAQVSEAEQGEKAGATAQADLGKVAGGGQAPAAGASEESSEPAHIKQLREMIKQLQKQMAEEQKQLADLMAQNTDDTVKLAAVTAKQASIATLNGQIMAATAQLLEALNKTGGSSAGGMVNTQA